MIRHAVRATVAVAALSLAVLSSLVQAQDTPSAQELTDLRALAEAGDIEAQYNLGVYAAGRGVSQDARPGYFVHPRRMRPAYAALR